MLNPSDKELDRLSREAAEHFEPEEQVSSWEQLVPRLDREIGIRPNTLLRYFGRGPIVYSAIILALTGVSYFFLKQQANELTNKNESTVAVEDLTKPAKKSDPRNVKASPDSKGNEEKQNAAIESDLEKKGAAETLAKTPSSVSSASTNNKSSTADQLRTEQTHIPPEGVPGNATENHQKNNLIKSPSSGAVVMMQSASNPNGQVENSSGKNGKTSIREADTLNDQDAKIIFSPLAGIVPLAAPHDATSNAVIKSNSKAKVQLSGAAIEQSKGTQKALRMNRALKIGLLFGSDVTSVNSVAPDRLSYSYGLTVGYQFMDHLSINTGLIYSQKSYSADAKDFHSPVSSLPSWANLKYVSGNCNMWEIPLTLRYDFDRIGNTTFFVNGGASTYLMSHESYVFFTENYYSGVLVSRQTPPVPYDTKENYPFAVIDFSLGVEQKLGKSLSLQVEPFVKIPTKGVGYGNLELSSYGVNFSLRYSPLLKTSKK